MLVAVIISHRLSPRATAQFGAEGKCSENIFATMRNEAIRNKPATRNRMVRMRSILRTEVDGTCGAPNAIPLSRNIRKASFTTNARRQLKRGGLDDVHSKV